MSVDPWFGQNDDKEEYISPLSITTEDGPSITPEKYLYGRNVGVHISILRTKKRSLRLFSMEG